MTWLQRARLPLLLAAPALLFTLVFYWRGLHVWFQLDDFAWMSQWIEVHSGRDLLRSLFAPRAQGSIRPISERAFFLGLQALFGWNPVPFHVVVFATQMVNLALLAALTLRLTGSRLAAGLAPLFWAASTALAVPLMWASVYNQILCATVFFAALLAWIAYCDTGRSRWLWAQYAIFLFGFGVLETVAVYPVLALSWVPGWRRWRAWAPLFAISASYTLVHQQISPTPTAGVYALHLDASILSTLGTYLRQVFGGPLLAVLPVAPWLQRLGTATPLLLGLPLVWFAVRKRNAAMLVPVALLMAPLLPVLPLRDHITHYYLTTPAAGLGLLLAWACAGWSRGRWMARGVAVAVAVLFLSTSMIVAARNRDFWFHRGQGVRTLMLGLARARAIHPDQTLVVTGLDGGRFYAALTANAARAMELGPVYLTPGSQQSIDPLPGEPAASTFEISWPALNKGLVEGSAVVYAPSGERLRNVSAIYRAMGHTEAQPEVVAGRVEPASPFYAAQLGEGWLGTGGQARWMGQRATALLPRANIGNRTSGDSKKSYATLVVEGYCPEVQFALGSFRIQASANGTSLGRLVVQPPAGTFRLEFGVPPDFVVTDRFQVTLESDHTLPLPDSSHASVLISAIFLR
jgi:hypothetical protein